MALSITTVFAGQRVGPGMAVFTFQTTGPVPVDDYLVLQMTRDSDGSGGPVGDHITVGQLSCRTVYGYTEKGLEFLQGNAWASGDACHIFAAQFHANNTLVDTSPSIACLYEPTAFLWGLIAKQIRLGPSQDARIFPAS